MDAKLMPVLRVLVALLIGASLALGAELRTLSGKVLTGELVSLTDKQVVLGGKNGRSTTPISELLLIDLHHESALPSGKYTDVELSDGCLFHCSHLTFKGKEVELKLAGSEQKFKAPLGAVSYLLNNAEDPAIRQEWQKLLAKRRNQDILAINREGVI